MGVSGTKPGLLLYSEAPPCFSYRCPHPPPSTPASSFSCD